MRDPTTLFWILGTGIGMSLVALVGAVSLVMKEATFKRLILPLVAFSAGSLLGGALLHMLPAALDERGESVAPFLWVLIGFAAFFALEQFLHWHHCHRHAADCEQDGRRPVGYLVLIGDGLHNFTCGLAAAGAFLVDVRLGLTVWLAELAHEVPQELGDFAVLVHGGWSRARALRYNVLSALTYPLGGIVAYVAASTLNVSFLVPFAAGNFIYIAASDLVPEVNRHHSPGISLLHLVSFVAGIALLLVMKLVLPHAH
jgi:zinc and cadmium transporter